MAKGMPGCERKRHDIALVELELLTLHPDPAASSGDDVERYRRVGVAGLWPHARRTVRLPWPGHVHAELKRSRDADRLEETG
jgi:hypothetical protein